MLTTQDSSDIVLQALTKVIYRVVPNTDSVEQAKSISVLHASEFSAIITVTGQINARLVIDGMLDLFKDLGSDMFGMSLSEEMLESFVGELANMLAGSLALELQDKLPIDITPPTVFVGTHKVSGFKRALAINCCIFKREWHVYVLLNE